MRRFKHSNEPTNTNAIIKLWMLRILIPLGGHKEFLQEKCFSDDSIAEAIDLGHWNDTQYSEEFDRQAIVADMRRIHLEAETQWADIPLPAPLENNIKKLSDLAQLNDIDCLLLGFLILLETEPTLRDVAKLLNDLAPNKTILALSQILNLPEQEIHTALATNSMLNRSGLITYKSDHCNLAEQFDFISHVFANKMAFADIEIMELLSDMIIETKPGHLELSDFDHIDSSLDILKSYLRFALETKKQGVNIFFYGIPGTGKTQLTRTLAKTLECTLFDIAISSAEDEPLGSRCRLQALCAAQNFISNRRALLVFDEAENMFNKSDWGENKKAWLNRLLEENTTPTIWISNTIDNMDPAYFRRFDMIVELPVPPQKQREHILRNACGDLLDDNSLKQIAKLASLAPGVVTRTNAVVRSVCNSSDQHKNSHVFKQLINNTLTAQGHQALATHDTSSLPIVYTPESINSTADAESVAIGLEKTGSGKLFLYGPTGTGKAAFAQYIATRLGMPLLIQHWSDHHAINGSSPEKELNQLFREAALQQAILYMEGIEHLIQQNNDYDMSSHRFLNQIRQFSGIFIASTDLIYGLDQNILDQFQLKVKFNFLHPKQVKELLYRYCAELKLTEPSPSALKNIVQLRYITPRDFANIVRQHALYPITSAEMLVATLEAECALKKKRK